MACVLPKQSHFSAVQHADDSNVNFSSLFIRLNCVEVKMRLKSAFPRLRFRDINGIKKQSGPRYRARRSEVRKNVTSTLYGIRARDLHRVYVQTMVAHVESQGVVLGPLTAKGKLVGHKCKIHGFNQFELDKSNFQVPEKITQAIHISVAKLMELMGVHT